VSHLGKFQFGTATPLFGVSCSIQAGSSSSGTFVNVKSLLLIKEVKHLWYLARLTLRGSLLNSELCKQALVKVGNPNVLVNLVSRRVRQLNSSGGSLSRPLVGEIGNAGVADIALREIIEEKIGFDMPEELAAPEPVSSRKRKKH